MMTAPIMVLVPTESASMAINGRNESNGHGLKRKEIEETHACVHLPRDSDVWLRRQLHEKLHGIRSEHDHAKRLTTYLDACGDGSNAPLLGLGSETCVCLTCEFSGPRDPSEADGTTSFMMHSILTNHPFALLPRHRQLFCAPCSDVVYPPAILSILQPPTTPSLASSSSSSSSTHWLTRKRRQPTLQRRLLRSSARRGLVNMGSTCFMNAVVQALAHNPLLQHEYFVLRSHNTAICEQRRQQARLSNGDADDEMAVCLGCELSSLLQTMFPAPRASLTRHHLASPVVPQTLLEALWAYDKSFVGAQQQDAHEFLVTLLNGVHQHTYSRAGMPPPLDKKALAAEPSPSQVASPRFTADGISLCDCVVHQTFAGVLQSRVICPFCKTVSGKCDPVLDLSLSLDGVASEGSNEAEGNTTHQVTLQALFDHFTAEERLKGREQVYCPPCGRYVEASKRLVLHKLPNLLVVHIKRLDFHKQRKIQEFVAFPTRGFDLREWCGDVHPAEGESTKTTTPLRDAVYDLAAVVNHHGDRVDGGHFTAYVQTPADEEEDEATETSERTQWRLFDDCEVESVSEDQVKQSQAYLLFYVRRRLFS
ncbi:hypothetical protein Poli38472_014093 [Pythium oligandrum]|uniref:Ubiquitin carboxyl-terminal hydrolase n=1 Tax=Pythium oligandrum TaxID=41045 RepID=A0A8K1FL54_PYTOL|nr:hypothetical protein Poli38472_014093 [Pythium oligandrum]|eukprot:TMW66781.1 hypothetical protein Poli38472_014093 [Pythium oligandrum]